MKIRLEQDELKRAVSWAARTLPARPSTNLHAGIRIDCGSDSIQLTTFDGETATKADIDAVIGEPGVSMVPGKLLAEIAKELPRQPVSLTLEGSRLAIDCGRSRFQLPTYPLDQQPELPAMPQISGEVDAEAFVAAVGQVHIAASRDDLLPPLTGILVELTGSHITFVATDRYRLAIRDVPWRPNGTAEDSRALVKARQLSDLAHSLDPGESVGVALGSPEEGKIGFSAAGRELITRVMQGEFPTYRQLLPDSASTTVTIDTESLLAAAKRVKIVNTERNTPIRLSFHDGEARLTATGVNEAAADESMECSIEGEPLDIAFNPELLLEGLNAAKSEQVSISCNGSGKAAVIRPTDGSGYRYLLMPMRLT